MWDYALHEVVEGVLVVVDFLKQFVNQISHISNHNFKFYHFPCIKS